MFYSWLNGFWTGLWVLLSDFHFQPIFPLPRPVPFIHSWALNCLLSASMSASLLWLSTLWTCLITFWTGPWLPFSAEFMLPERVQYIHSWVPFSDEFMLPIRVYDPFSDTFKCLPELLQTCSMPFWTYSWTRLFDFHFRLILCFLDVFKCMLMMLLWCD